MSVVLWRFRTLPPGLHRMIKNVSLRHLRCFLAVAEAGSFTNAAHRLSVTQSTLTATIRQLEEAVGVRMFDRTTRKVAMTQEAERFKPEAERLLAQFSGALSDLQAFSEGRQGHIRIAAAASIIEFFLIDAIRIFRESYPLITFSIRDAGAELVERLVSRGEIDFAITSPYKGLDDLSYTPLLEDDYGIVCNPTHPLARRKSPPRWADLMAEGYVGFTADTGIGSYLREHAGCPALFQGNVDEISSSTSLHLVLKTGPCYSILPALSAGTSEFSPYVFHVLEPRLSRRICLITRPFRSLSPSARAFLKIIQGMIDKASLPPSVRVSAGIPKR